MRKVNYIYSLILLLFPLCSVLAQSPSAEKNYIYIQEPLDSVKQIKRDTAAIRTIQYFDGLGRPEQTIMIQATPGQTPQDIVTKIEYDEFGRQTLDYLPAPSNQSNGKFIGNSQLGSLYNDYYISGTYTGQVLKYNTKFYYSEKILESSPFNRVMKQAAPGDDWSKGSGHEIEFEYQTNTSTEVRLFKVNSDGDLVPSGKYPAGQLYKVITTDENGNKIHEFTDKMGRVVLKRTFVEEGSSASDRPDPNTESTQTAETYYIYDKYGNLSFVIPPLAAEKSNINAVLDELCYQYKYDDRNRLIEKKLPGKDWEYMIYDKQDRLVAVQDANLRAENKWLFTKYDKFGRVVYTGIFENGGSRSTVQGLVGNYGSNNEKRSGSFSANGNTIKYTKVAFPTSFTEILTVNYYDTYEDYTPTGNYLTNLKGMPTTTHVKIIDKNQWEKIQTAYDYKGRPVFTYKSNHLGGSTQVETELDFRGKPLTVVTTHKRNSTGTVVKTTEEFTYDHQERLLTHSHKIGDSGQVNYLARNTYDPLGQLVTKDVGGNQASGSDRWQNIDYKYNIRGWLTAINKVDDFMMGEGSYPPAPNDDLFSLKINYENPQGSGNTAAPLYNGNISQIFWKSGTDNIKRGYNYTYDKLNRLRGADFYKAGNSTIKAYDEYISYDMNGNITSLFRTTGDESDNEIEMDKLTYSYFTNSNRLKNVKDITGNTSGFADGNDYSSTGLDDYEYDLNGNLILDRNKGIESITYNYLNLPTEVYWDGDHKITYLYNAVGEKVQKMVRDSSEIKIVDYLDGFQYAGGELQFFPHAEGYVDVTEISTASGSTSYIFNYVYNHTDHLGNIRVRYTKKPQTGELNIIEENHYYPFGLKHEVYTPANRRGFIEDKELSTSMLVSVKDDEYKYKYNGKEWQDELNLNLYDYHARNYDPALGRWMNMDPLAEKFMDVSPYNYAMNNPVVFIDPDGMEAVNIGYDMVVDSKSISGSMTWTGGFDIIKGVDKQSAEKLHEDINTVFADSKFDNFRSLITRGKNNNKKTFDKINEDDFNNAVSGLSGDDLYAATSIYNAINSESIITFEFINSSTQKLSSSGQEVYTSYSKNVFGYTGSNPKNFTGQNIIDTGGEGLAYFTVGGAHVFVVNVPGTMHLEGLRSLTTFHELGHGIGFMKKIMGLMNEFNAIRFENMIRRVMNIETMRDGTNPFHGGGLVPKNTEPVYYK